MRPMPARLDVQTTRLFPKHKGATAYRLEGIAARCDWVLMTDHHSPITELRRPGRQEAPRTVYLSLRSPFTAITAFADEVLPKLTAPFVLVSGSEDVTVPRQTDARWRAFDAGEQDRIARILAHPRLCHWFAENLSDAGHPRLSPLPLGLVFADGRPADGVPFPRVPPVSSRPLRVLVAHRVREGAQWQTRRKVSSLARTAWAEFCTIPEGEIAPEAYERLVQEHAFVLCAQGGGVDPSPKAWQALQFGAIPIVQRGPLDEAYAQLPVAFVDDWSTNSLSLDVLARWQSDLAPRLEGEGARERLHERLGIDYWWRRIEAAWHP